MMGRWAPETTTERRTRRPATPMPAPECGPVPTEPQRDNLWEGLIGSSARRTLSVARGCQPANICIASGGHGGMMDTEGFREIWHAESPMGTREFNPIAAVPLPRRSRSPQPPASSTGLEKLRCFDFHPTTSAPHVRVVFSCGGIQAFGTVCGDACVCARRAIQRNAVGVSERTNGLGKPQTTHETSHAKTTLQSTTRRAIPRLR